MKNHLGSVLALLAIVAISVASGAVLRMLHSGFSSAVFGMVVLLLVLFALGRSTPAFERASHWLLRYFPLLFVPSCVGAMRFETLLRASWLGIAVALIGSTILGIAVAATVGTLVASRRESA